MTQHENNISIMQDLYQSITESLIDRCGRPRSKQVAIDIIDDIRYMVDR